MSLLSTHSLFNDHRKHIPKYLYLQLCSPLKWKSEVVTAGRILYLWGGRRGGEGTESEEKVRWMGPEGGHTSGREETLIWLEVEEGKIWLCGGGSQESSPLCWKSKWHRVNHHEDLAEKMSSNTISEASYQSNYRTSSSALKLTIQGCNSLHMSIISQLKKTKYIVLLNF